jgi:hypothetical protein
MNVLFLVHSACSAALLHLTQSSRGSPHHPQTLLASLPSTPFEPLPAKDAPTVIVNSSVRYQTVLGFGGAFTEAVCKLAADFIAKLSHNPF